MHASRTVLKLSHWVDALPALLSLKSQTILNVLHIRDITLGIFVSPPLSPAFSPSPSTSSPASRVSPFTARSSLRSPGPWECSFSRSRRGLGCTPLGHAWSMTAVAAVLQTVHRRLYTATTTNCL